MLVRDIMNATPVTAGAQDSVLAVARRMRAGNIGAIPIVDDQQRPIGLLTDRDIVLRCVAENRVPERCRVGDILSGQVIAVDADRTLEYASRLMAEHQVRRLPVVERGRLIGMISLGDIAVRHPEKPAVAEVIEGVSNTRAHRSIAATTARRRARTHR
jgi:CBS domain-containing protein